MKTRYYDAKCGRKIRRNGRMETCRLIPAMHGIERNRPYVMVSHPFVFVGKPKGDGDAENA